MVTTRRSSLRVSFKDDNEDTLMKPPCETKVFDTDAPPSSISSDEDTQVYPDEEEYLKLKRSKNAWKPKSQMTVHEQQKISTRFAIRGVSKKSTKNAGLTLLTHGAAMKRMMNCKKQNQKKQKNKKEIKSKKKQK